MKEGNGPATQTESRLPLEMLFSASNPSALNRPVADYEVMLHEIMH